MRPSLCVSLLGRFAVRSADRVLLEHAPHKAQELLAYLVVNRGRPHPREALAELLWTAHERSPTRKYLRQALWHLRSELAAVGQDVRSQILRIDPGWVEFVPSDAMDADVVAVERAHASSRGTRAVGLAPDAARSLADAVRLYRGELLEGWYAPWCLQERELFRRMYLDILDKLTDYSEARGEYEPGMAYARLALKCDRARERTHRSLMQLLVLFGDRTGALRQFQECVTALREEFDAAPDPRTTELYEEIRRGQAGDPGPDAPVPPAGLRLRTRVETARPRRAARASPQSGRAQARRR